MDPDGLQRMQRAKRSGKAIRGLIEQYAPKVYDQCKKWFKDFFKKSAKPKEGSRGGSGSAKNFSTKIKDASREEAGNQCVFCGIKTKKTQKPDPQRSHIDHSVPKSRGGNNT
jgi:hypothetical protein